VKRPHGESSSFSDQRERRKRRTSTISEIERVYNKYHVIQLRPLKSEKLVAGCGNSPLLVAGYSSVFLATPEFREKHSHSGSDTIDHISMNPTIVGYLGSEEVTHFLNGEKHQYNLIKAEGFPFLQLDAIINEKEDVIHAVSSMREGLTKEGFFDDDVLSLRMIQGDRFAINDDLTDAEGLVVALPESDFEALRRVSAECEKLSEPLDLLYKDAYDFEKAIVEISEKRASLLSKSESLKGLIKKIETELSKKLKAVGLRCVQLGLPNYLEYADEFQQKTGVTKKEYIPDYGDYAIYPVYQTTSCPNIRINLESAYFGRSDSHE